MFINTSDNSLEPDELLGVRCVSKQFVQGHSAEGLMHGFGIIGKE